MGAVLPPVYGYASVRVPLLACVYPASLEHDQANDTAADRQAIIASAARIRNAMAHVSTVETTVHAPMLVNPVVVQTLLHMVQERSHTSVGTKAHTAADGKHAVRC
jgi:hypothetical protein